MGLEWSICLENLLFEDVVRLAHLYIRMIKSVLVITMYRVAHLFGCVLVLAIVLNLATTSHIL